jgi:signal transduction histidine kinase
MNPDILIYANTIIATSKTLLRDSQLSAKQREVIGVISRAANEFVRIYNDCMAMPFEQFARELRHEIMNPLTPIRGYTEMLLIGMIGTLTPEQQEFVQQIAESGNLLRSGVDVVVNNARKLVAAKAVTA